MSGAGDHKGRPYGFIPEFNGLEICSMGVRGYSHSIVPGGLLVTS